MIKLKTLLNKDLNEQGPERERIFQPMEPGENAYGVEMQLDDFGDYFTHYMIAIGGRFVALTTAWILGKESVRGISNIKDKSKLKKLFKHMSKHLDYKLDKKTKKCLVQNLANLRRGKKSELNPNRISPSELSGYDELKAFIDVSTDPVGDLNDEKHVELVGNLITSCLENSGINVEQFKSDFQKQIKNINLGN
jgi:hypothetical protein